MIELTTADLRARARDLRERPAKDAGELEALERRSHQAKGLEEYADELERDGGTPIQIEGLELVCEGNASVRLYRGGKWYTVVPAMRTDAELDGVVLSGFDLRVRLGLL